jgi:hypothetical protein
MFPEIDHNTAYTISERFSDMRADLHRNVLKQLLHQDPSPSDIKQLNVLFIEPLSEGYELYYERIHLGRVYYSSNYKEWSLTFKPNKSLS